MFAKKQHELRLQAIQIVLFLDVFNTFLWSCAVSLLNIQDPSFCFIDNPSLPPSYLPSFVCLDNLLTPCLDHSCHVSVTWCVSVLQASVYTVFVAVHVFQSICSKGKAKLALHCAVFLWHVCAFPIYFPINTNAYDCARFSMGCVVWQLEQRGSIEVVLWL